MFIYNNNVRHSVHIVRFLRGGSLTACGLTGLALLAHNGFKTWNFYKPTVFEPTSSGQIRVERLLVADVTHSPLTYRLQTCYPQAMDIKSKTGNKIRKLRHQWELTQEQFANLCGLDRTYITGIEQGKRNVPIVNLEKIAKAFEISLSELFEDL